MIAYSEHFNLIFFLPLAQPPYYFMVVFFWDGYGPLVFPVPFGIPLEMVLLIFLLLKGYTAFKPIQYES